MGGGLERTPINGALVFTAFGLLFGAIAKDHKPKYLLAAEGTGDTLSLITWVVFGEAVIGQSINAFSWQVVLYAILSLTVVRMLPVFLVLGGMLCAVTRSCSRAGLGRAAWPVSCSQ